jgi:hemerythrin
MSLITWTEGQFGCKVDYVDEEHKGIFAGINEMYARAEAQASFDDMREQIDKVISIVFDHFEHENSDMKKANFSGYDMHKEEHDNLLTMCTELYGAFKEEKDDSIIIELGELIKMWLENHIPTFDFAYADSVASVQ